MVCYAPRRERDIRPQLLPEPQAARVARRFLLCFDTAELDACRTQRGLGRHPAPCEIVGAQLDVAPELLVHVALERRAVEHVPEDGADTADEHVHIESGVASRAAVIPATTCS